MLTQVQTDYIVSTTNARGDANTPKVQYLGSSEIDDGNSRWLNIVGVQVDDPNIVHGYTPKDTHGGLGQPDVTDAFKDLVDKAITGMLRHF